MTSRCPKPSLIHGKRLSQGREGWVFCYVYSITYKGGKDGNTLGKGQWWWWGRESLKPGWKWKVSNQGENTESLRYSLGRKILLQKLHGSLCLAAHWGSLLRFSLMTMKRPRRQLRATDPHVLLQHVSTSDLPLLLADRKLEQKAPSLPTWLSGRWLSPQPPAFLGHLQWNNWGDVVIWVFLVHFQELSPKLLRFESSTYELVSLLFIKK